MKSKKTIRTVAGADQIITYELIRKSIKNMYLRLREDGTVAVTANRLIPLSAVDAFVLKNEPFIARSRTRVETEQERLSERAALQYVTGETLRIFGNEVRFVLKEGRPARVEFPAEIKREPFAVSDAAENCVIMTAPSGYDTERRKRLYEKELRFHTEKCLTEICTRVWPLFKPYGVTWPELKFRTMKSRWGSCQPVEKKITLNLRLIEKPYAAAEYVVVHEFAHFLHADHSPRFYAVVEHFLPDYKERKKLLK